MSDWLKSIVGYMLIVSVTMQVLPNRKYEQYVKLFTGCVLIILVLHPILKMGDVSTFLENRISQYVQEQEAFEAELGKEKIKFQEESGQQMQEKQEKIDVVAIEQVEVVIHD